QAIRRAKREHDRDSGMFNDEIGQGARLHLADLMAARPWGEETVVEGKIAVKVNSADSVLIPGLVAVIVPPFGEKAPGTALAFGVVSFQEQPRFLRVENILPIGIGHAPPADRTIAIDVVRAIL